MNYGKKIKKEKLPIIILHGWGLRGSTYNKIYQSLKHVGYSVYALDLPGFGSEPLRKKKMTLDDYVDFVYDFIKSKKFKKIILIGHSFGGRVSIKFAIAFPEIVKAMVLTGAPGIKQKLSFSKSLLRHVAVIVSEIFRFQALLPLKYILRKGLYFIIGEWDYYNAGDLRETFKSVIAEDLSPLLSQVSSSTLLVWGNKDTVVPLDIGISMRDLIPNAKLVVIENQGHKLPYESPMEFFRPIISFIEKI